MALDIGKFGKLSAGSMRKAVNNLWSILSTDDTLATMIASGYFDEVADKVAAGDIIWVNGSDESAFVEVTSGADVTPVTVVKVTGNEANFSGTANYGGGGTQTAITETGVDATMFPLVNITASTNAVSIVKVVPTANTITVDFSADPGAATTLSYMVFPATS